MLVSTRTVKFSVLRLAAAGAGAGGFLGRGLRGRRLAGMLERGAQARQQRPVVLRLLRRLARQPRVYRVHRALHVVGALQDQIDERGGDVELRVARQIEHRLHVVRHLLDGADLQKSRPGP